MMENNQLSTTLKQLRKEYHLTQEDMAFKAGVGLRFVREMEQGKATLTYGQGESSASTVQPTISPCTHSKARTTLIIFIEMRQGQVFVKNQLAGIITEDETGYGFTYAQAYLDSDHPTPVSLTLPFKQEGLSQHVLFSFFDGLIPEGWMLNIAERNWKINRHDRMGLLLSCCRDCIGDISIVPIEQKEVER